ncbi:inactive serine protease 54 isoform X1 [Pelobates cultripes]|uniref:Inactive serine protease 54 isoform X1 n=1 Tax=Pelobates cultripes TaxID=61616 RepID=A0AAD1RIT8_PELCU|nr:inactive serine protease 54 isoform X1 [Pelobates cultripes]
MKWMEFYYTLILLWTHAERTFSGCGNRMDMTFSSGKIEAAPGEFPWQVSVEFDKNPYCSGTIISEFWIVSSAKCFAHIDNKLEIRVGVINLNVKGKMYPVKTLVLHNEYVQDENAHNIALLESSNEIEFNDLVQPVCFPEDQVLEIDHLSNCWITTWRISFLAIPLPAEVLEKLSVIPKEVCTDHQNTELLCGNFGDLPAEQRITVDSGDSLVCQFGWKKIWTLIGIVSKPVYTRDSTIKFVMTTKYITWVKQYTALSGKPVIPAIDLGDSQGTLASDEVTNQTVTVEENPDLKMEEQNVAVMLDSLTFVIAFPTFYLVFCMIFVDK